MRRLMVSVFVIMVVLGAVSAQDGLVAYYPFNGNANDESGNGNNGTVYGATLAADRFGIVNSAYSFDGVDDYIQVPYDPSLQPTEQLTVSAFAKLSEYSSYQMILNNHAPGGWAVSVYQDSVRIDIQFPANDDRIVVAFSLSDYPVNTWFQVVGVYDGSNVILYFNGEMQNEY